MPPESLTAALDQISELRCAPRFGGYRGSPPLDVTGTAGVLLGLAAITRDVPEIREIDLNPLVVDATGVCAIDVRIRVGGAAWAEQPIRSLLTGGSGA